MAILADSFYYQELRIDTINTRVFADIVAKEGDANGRGLLVTLTENGLMKDTTGIALNLKWEHTSVGNQGVDNFEAVDLSKGLYKITYPAEMLNRGKVRAFIQIIDSGKLAGIRNIEITVDRGVGDDTAIVSSNSFTALAQALIDVNNLESTYAPELLSVKQQLADTLNKSAITLTHMFADNTARDAYFVEHPTELVELQFIKVGTAYQQYIEGVWTDSVPIVSEQLSATNQPIVDTGEYFVAENINEALQELGAHKVSTSNPHGVTKAQVGLGNVDNTSDANKPVSTAMQTALNLKANKTQEEWIAPTLLNSWVDHSPGVYSTIGYYKDALGIVHLKGVVKNGTSNIIFELPLGYRPSRFLFFETGTTIANGQNATAALYIAENGEVYSYATTRSAIFLDGIAFRPEG